MNHSFCALFTVGLLTLLDPAFASHNATGTVEPDYVCNPRVEKKCHAVPGRRVDLDNPTPDKTQTARTLLGRYSYVLPYLPNDLSGGRNSPEAGPCTWEGLVVRNARSRRDCLIYASAKDAGIYKVMIERKDGETLMFIPRIWRRDVNAPNAWAVWVEFERGTLTAVSRDAERFVAAHGRGTDHTKHPALADRYPRQPATDRPSQQQQTGSGTSETPGDIGSALRDQVLKRLK